jgi:hypothetical protein
MRVEGEKLSSIALNLAVRTVTALALLASMLSPNRSSTAASNAGHAECVGRKIATPSSQSSRLCASWMSARPDRVKAFAPDDDDEIARAIPRARCRFGLSSTRCGQTTHVLPEGVCPRTNTPLRC